VHASRTLSRTPHSGAQFEASLRGLAAQLELFPCEVSLIADALTYCDLTTSSTGEHISLQERLDDIFRRYDENHIVSQAIRQAIPYLSGIVERVQNERIKISLAAKRDTRTIIEADLFHI